MVFLYVPGVQESSLDLVSWSLFIAQSVTSRGKRMQPQFWQRAWKRVPWLKRLFGLTFGISTGNHGLGSWMWSLRATRANPSQSQASERAQQMSAGYGPTFGESFAKYDHSTSSWKTSQPMLLKDLTEFLGTWPKVGTMRNGTCFRRRASELPISGNGYSYWPTPAANDDNRSPEAHLAMKARMKGGPRRAITRLAPMVKAITKGMWPTPRCCNGLRSGGANRSEFYKKFWPTPKARDAHFPGQSESKRHSPMLAHQVNPNGGQLNPMWVAWLMGFPIGWTDLERSAMQSYRSWRQKHGVS